MRVATEKKEHTVTVKRGDIESADNFKGDWDQLSGEAKIPFCVKDEGFHWKLIEDVEDITKVKPSQAEFVWKKTDFEIGSFTGIPLDPSEEIKITKKFTKYIKIKGQVLPDPDYVKIKLAKIKEVINNWDLLDDNNKKPTPVPCDDEMKKVVYLCNPEVIDEAMLKFSEIGRDGGYNNREIELKN